jgi:hypothetical protein
MPSLFAKIYSSKILFSIRPHCDNPSLFSLFAESEHGQFLHLCGLGLGDLAQLGMVIEQCLVKASHPSIPAIVCGPTAHDLAQLEEGS